MGNFLEKTIVDIKSAFEDIYYADLNAAKNGIMQVIDPRVKLISILALMVIANLCKNFYGIGLLFLYVLLLAALSRIDYKTYLLRVCVVSFLFSGVVLIPSVFNVVSGGRPFLYLSKELYITREGLISALFLMVRSFVSLSLIYLVAVTTKWYDLMKSLRFIGVPSAFVAPLEMTYRYIFLLLELASNMFLARKSRTVRKISGAEGRKFIASSTGYLLLRSWELSGDVYDAMVSRGYRGEIKALKVFKVKPLDYMWIGLNIAFAFIVAVKGGIF